MAMNPTPVGRPRLSRASWNLRWVPYLSLDPPMGYSAGSEQDSISADVDDDRVDDVGLGVGDPVVLDVVDRSRVATRARVADERAVGEGRAGLDPHHAALVLSGRPASTLAHVAAGGLVSEVR